MSKIISQPAIINPTLNTEKTEAVVNSVQVQDLQVAQNSEEVSEPKPERADIYASEKGSLSSGEVKTLSPEAQTSKSLEHLALQFSKLEKAPDARSSQKLLYKASKEIKQAQKDLDLGFGLRQSAEARILEQSESVNILLTSDRFKASLPAMTEQSKASLKDLKQSQVHLRQGEQRLQKAEEMVKQVVKEQTVETKKENSFIEDCVEIFASVTELLGSFIDDTTTLIVQTAEIVGAFIEVKDMMYDENASVGDKVIAAFDFIGDASTVAVTGYETGKNAFATAQTLVDTGKEINANLRSSALDNDQKVAFIKGSVRDLNASLQSSLVEIETDEA